jgi:hypothetical protein
MILQNAINRTNTKRKKKPAGIRKEEQKPEQNTNTRHEKSAARKWQVPRLQPRECTTCNDGGLLNT